MSPGCALTIFYILFCIVQVNAYGSYGSIPPCSLTMTSYNSICANWTVLSVIAFKNSTMSQVEAAKNYLQNVMRNCNQNSHLKIFFPGTSQNDNNLTCSFGLECDSFYNSADPSSAKLNDKYPTTQFEMLLTYAANYAMKFPTAAGAIFIFTDLNACEMDFFLTSFLQSQNQTYFNLKFFFYDNPSCVRDCGDRCDMVYGLPEDKGETTCRSVPVVPKTSSTTTTTTATTGTTATSPKTKTTTSSTTPEPTTVEYAPPNSTVPQWKPDPPFPNSVQLALIIGIPSLALIVLCGICACCCCKCMDVKKQQAKAFFDYKDRQGHFKGFKNRFFSRKGEDHDPSAPEIEICEDGVPITPPANFAVSNHYMDLAHLAKRNKKDYWEFQSKNLMIHDNEVLGAGAFATVYRATVIGKVPLLKAVTGVSAQLENTQDGRCDAAVKRLPGHADEQNRKDFFHEMEFMKRLGYHAHLIAMLGCISDAWDPLIVVEYCHYGDLLRFIRCHRNDFFGASSSNDTEKSKTVLTIKNLVSFAWQISDGMSYLSSRNFVHRDLAARNVLVTRNLVMKVSDFGLCRYTDQALYTAKGGKLPIKWMSTEALKFGEFSAKSDVWSFGVTLWELFSLGETPYNAVQPTDMLIHLEDGNRLLKPQFCPNEIQEIMTSTWDVDSVRRPSFEEIRAKITVMLNFNDESYGYLTVVHKEADNSTCAVEEEYSGTEKF